MLLLCIEEPLNILQSAAFVARVKIPIQKILLSLEFRDFTQLLEYMVSDIVQNQSVRLVFA